MAKTIHTPSWLKFVKPKRDFFALLESHAQLVNQGFIGLHDWLKNGAHDRCEHIHDCEHKADEVKHQIEKSLADTFVTPFDREEIYDLCERIDLTLTGAKMMVKDIEFFSADESDEYLIQMSEVLAKGSEKIAQSIEQLKTDVQKAEELANEIRKTQTELANIFRAAMKSAYEETDARKLVRKKQLYDYMTEIAFRISKVGEKLLHLSVKNG
jgi:uncharacterized protein Yka (UPF0111/DUF47 family)